MADGKFQVGDVVRLKSDTHRDHAKYVVVEVLPNDVYAAILTTADGPKQFNLPGVALVKSAEYAVQSPLADAVRAADGLKEWLVEHQQFESAAELRDLAQKWKVSIEGRL